MDRLMELAKAQPIIEYKYIESIYKDSDSLHNFFRNMKKERKIAVFFGNCQIAFLEKIMAKSDEFCQKYIMVHLEAVHLMDDICKRKGIDKDLIAVIDLFVYQEVFDEAKYGNLVTEKVTSGLNPDCKTIIIPNCFFKGYHPQVIKNKRNALLGSKYNEGGVVPYGDSILESCFNAAIDIYQLEEYMYSDDCMSQSMIMENLENTLRELKRREESCDICISDYIERHYRDTYLFYTPSHPCNLVLYELSRRILSKLCMKDDFPCPALPENNRFEVLIYPIVFKTLGLAFEKETFYFCNTLYAHRDTLTGYALKYRKYCFPEIGEDVTSHTLDISHLVQLDSEYLEARSASCMTYNQGSVHLAMYLTIKKEIPNICVISFSEMFAPRRSFISAGICINSFCPIHICTDGRIKVNKPKFDSKIMVIDMVWNI